jgi:hypothetical protein
VNHNFIFSRWLSPAQPKDDQDLPAVDVDMCGCFLVLCDPLARFELQFKFFGPSASSPIGLRRVDVEWDGERGDGAL